MPRTPHDPLDDEGRADLAARIAAARLLAGDTLGALRVLDMGLPVEQPTEAVA